jgi:hypothetical protein
MLISTDTLVPGDFSTSSAGVSYLIFKEFTPLGLLFNFGFLNSVTLLVIIIIFSVSFVYIFQVESIFEILATALFYIFMYTIYFFYLFFI